MQRHAIHFAFRVPVSREPTLMAFVRYCNPLVGFTCTFYVTGVGLYYCGDNSKKRLTCKQFDIKSRSVLEPALIV
jgi:hypothetical protein